MSDSLEKKWYVVRAVSGQENKVKNYIDSELIRVGLSDMVGQILVPTEKVFQIRNGKKIRKPISKPRFNSLIMNAGIITRNGRFSISFGASTLAIDINKSKSLVRVFETMNFLNG